MEIADSVLELIGNTPMVRLRQVGSALACPVVAKVETSNPGGSSKDRPALTMIEQAERDGLLKPGGTIVEPTSGNTGVGLAIVAAQRGYNCIFVVTDKVAPEKVDLLKAYGAEVVVCPVAVPPEDPNSYYSTAERLVAETPNAFRPNQYANPANPAAHYETTGPEIWRQTDGRVTHFVAGAGTGGTLTGVDQDDVRHHAHAMGVGEVILGGHTAVAPDESPTRRDLDLADQRSAVDIERARREMSTAHFEAERTAGNTEEQQQWTLLLPGLRGDRAQVIDPRQRFMTLAASLRLRDTAQGLAHGQRRKQGEQRAPRIADPEGVAVHSTIMPDRDCPSCP